MNKEMNIDTIVKAKSFLDGDEDQHEKDVFEKNLKYRMYLAGLWVYFFDFWVYLLSIDSISLSLQYGVYLTDLWVETKDLKCATHLLSEKFEQMSEKKKAIVWDLGFGRMMHISPMRVHHKLLKELANSFKLEKNTLETGYGLFRIKPSTIGTALGLNASSNFWLKLRDLSKTLIRRLTKDC
ncbi:hypothetical protein AHAS_Ahas05G0099300 [Arachis hypogaea]